MSSSRRSLVPAGALLLRSARPYQLRHCTVPCSSSRLRHRIPYPCHCCVLLPCSTPRRVCSAISLPFGPAVHAVPSPVVSLLSTRRVSYASSVPPCFYRSFVTPGALPISLFYFRREYACLLLKVADGCSATTSLPYACCTSSCDPVERQQRPQGRFALFWFRTLPEPPFLPGH